MPVNFTCDVGSTAEPFPHFWEHTVGSGHATLALRADWQQQLKRCSKELGFKYVRFHGILSDDMGTLTCQNEQLIYSFFNADQVFDFLHSIEMYPFVELSFMPSTLSSGDDTVFHYKANVTPPRDYAAWDEFIKTLVQHWKERYGNEVIRQWFFEVWNEPNLHSFWTGSQSDYFQLYKHTAAVIKNIDKKLKVGGPATAKNEWITDFKKFCDDGKIPYDFISTHHYPTDAFGQPGDDTITQLAKSRRSILRDEISATKQQAGNTPVYYTEWCTSSNPFDDLHDEPYAAAFIAKTIVEAKGFAEGYSYWTFSDIFEENYFSSVPFHGGFGLMNIYGIPKPAYRAYEMLHRLGNLLIPVKGVHPTIDAWAFINENNIQLLLTNFALPRHPINSESVQIDFENIPPVKKVFAEKIDEQHANAKGAWGAMQQPSTLNAEQVNELEDASKLISESISFKQHQHTLGLEIELAIQSTTLITLELK